ncbi:hypothetical protein ACFFGH_28270 [Lysobacter korlensis]|uniref:Uncharacterized protein n=1 Tax=Lysobacter korlensis TaxID=553636 RepID=A0ABV6RXN7_9GAMM
MSGSALRTRPLRRTALGAALVAALLAAGSTPVATAAVSQPVDIDFVTPDPSDEYGITLKRVVGGANEEDWPFGNQPGSYLEVKITTLNALPQEFGLGADLHEQGATEYLWLPETWNDPPGDGGLSSVFRAFATEAEPLVQKIPDWPGATFAFYRLDDGSGPLPEPELIGTYTTTGGFVPLAVDMQNGEELNVGRIATVSGAEIFPGATATVTASGLTPGDQLGLWLAPGYDYFWFILSGAALPPGSVPVGSGVVDASGNLSAPFVVPTDTDYGPYQLMVGDPATRDWPAGTARSFEVLPPEESGTVPTPTGSGVAVDVPLGPTSVGLTFPSVTGVGDTTVVSSATGPTVSGFTIPLDPQLYFHIDTTADHTTPVEVCISYDAAEAPGMIDLYHYTVVRDSNGVPIGSQWQNITTTREPGVVCGLTDSFSPFTLGVPADPKAKKAQCLNGGWQLNASPVFKNEGACVRYFAKQR